MKRKTRRLRFGERVVLHGTVTLVLVALIVGLNLRNKTPEPEPDPFEQLRDLDFEVTVKCGGESFSSAQLAVNDIAEGCQIRISRSGKQSPIWFGNRVAALDQLSAKVVSFDCPSTVITARDVPVLAKMTQVQELTADADNLQSRDFWFLSQLPNLQHLELYSVFLDDWAMRNVVKYDSLEVLKIGRSQITDYTISRLTESPIQILHVDNTRVTDAALPHIAQMKQLRELNLSATQITAQSARYWKEMESLEVLDLRRTQVDDSVAEVLAETQIQRVVIGETKITSYGIMLLEMNGVIVETGLPLDLVAH